MRISIRIIMPIVAMKYSEVIFLMRLLITIVLVGQT
jgi:hypothetical protein